MSQIEVYQYLKKHNGWHDSKEIAEALEISKLSANANLRRLNHDGFVQSKIEKTNRNYKKSYKLKNG